MRNGIHHSSVCTTVWFFEPRSSTVWNTKCNFHCNPPLQLVAHRNAQGYLNTVTAKLTQTPKLCKASFFLDCHTKCFGYILRLSPHQTGQGNDLWRMEFKLYLCNRGNMGLSSASTESSCLPKHLPINLIEVASVCLVSRSRKHYFSC